MYKVTASWINSTWFATWLTPTLRILLDTWALLRQVTMTEVWEGNYKYDFIDIENDKLYFFNIDAWVDTVIGRYKVGTNQIEDATAWTRNVFRQASRREDIDGLLDKKLKPLFDTYNKPVMFSDNSEQLLLITKLVSEEIAKNKTYIDYEQIENLIESKVSNIKFPEIEKPKEVDLTPIKESIGIILEEFKKWLEWIKETVYPLVDDRNKKVSKKEKELTDKLLEKIAEQIIEDSLLEDLLLKAL